VRQGLADLVRAGGLSDVLPVESVIASLVAVVCGALVGVLADRIARSGSWYPEDGAVATPRSAVWTALVGAALFAAVTLRFGLSADLPAWLWFAALGLLLSMVDLQASLLPNRLLLPGTAVALVLLVLAAAVDDRWTDLRRAVLAGAVSFAVLLVMALLAPTGLGMGDVKLGVLLGLMLGWVAGPLVLTGFLFGFIAQAVVGLALLAVRRAGRRTQIPFGPALLTGALAAVLLSGDWVGFPGAS
jgi:leader peptidase (prepilin peptidase)/N-methyltransferase